MKTSQHSHVTDVAAAVWISRRFKRCGSVSASTRSGLWRFLTASRATACALTRPLSPAAGFEYYEASAKENINVRQVFERLVDIICVKMSERVDVEAPAAAGTKTARLSDKPAQLPQKCC